ncbi:MAG: hypothetical protein HC877_11215 [Thioploca sp.]|nr:hypothetical protein [Thioploca sp.]
MKTQQSYNFILLVYLLAGWIPISQAYVKSHSEASMFNIQINPSLGSVIWLNDWKIESAAEIQSSAGSKSESDTGGTQTSVNISVNGAGVSATAAADASTSASNISGSILNARTDAELSGESYKYVIKFADSTLSRDFKITGGIGNVDVQFSYQYLAHLMGEADVCGHFEVEYVVNLEITDGSTAHNITAFDKIAGTNTSKTSKNENDSGNPSQIFTLIYEKPYSIIANVDNENYDTDECPTLAELLDLKATRVSEGIKLEWQTATELDNAGFDLWRSETENGEYIKITDSLIPAKGNDSTYTFIDNNVEPGVTYYYQLEDIDFLGKSTFQNPISSSANEVLIIEPATNVIFTPDTPPRFEWRSDDYSEFKFQFSEDNGKTLCEVPNEWIAGTAMVPPSTIWKNFAQARKGQTFLWRIIGENGQGQAFSEMRRLTIE